MYSLTQRYGEEGLKGGPPPETSAAGGVPHGFASAQMPPGFSFQSFSSGPGGFSGKGGFKPSRAEDIFAQFFGGLGGMGGFGGLGDDVDSDAFMGGGFGGGRPGRSATHASEPVRQQYVRAAFPSP